MENKLQLAILDMYDNTPNQGMRAIQSIVKMFDHKVDWQIFDVRAKHEVPDTSFDIYICSGGPGDPREGDGIWDQRFFQLLDELWAINAKEAAPSKYVFFICHSFQMACYHFDLALVTERRSRSFGTFPTHKTKAGEMEPLFGKLPDPFYVADFRDYQVVQPKLDAFEEMGAEVLVLEKIRPHIPLERAIMAIRFSEAFFGTQFHPEADPEGMLIHFSQEDKKTAIIEQHGQEKYDQMMADLNDPFKIELTHQQIIPTFLDHAIKALSKIVQHA
ncbi:MAG: GMP synthase [Bacteroidota bacterium]